MATLKRGLTRKTEEAARQASKPEAARSRPAPAWSEDDYLEAVAFLEDPDVSEEDRKGLSRDVNAYSQANPELAAKVAVPEVGHLAASGSSSAAIKKTKSRMRSEGYDKIASPEEYKTKKAALEGHLEEKGELTQKAKIREQDVDETTMPEDMAGELGADVAEFEQENPELRVGSAQGQVLFDENGMPVVSEGPVDLMRQIDQEAEAAKEKAGVYKINSALASASGREDLYADPEYLPPNSGFMDLMNAERHHEPPLELAKAALREKLGSNVERLTENDSAYHRFADAYWQEARAKAEAAGKPLVRVAYFADEKWKNRSASRQAMAVGDKAMPYGAFLSGVEKSLTGGIGSELLLGGAGKLMGRDLTREKHDLEARHPYLHGGGQAVGAAIPGGLGNRVFSAIAGKAPGALRAGAAGAVTGATESGVQDVVHNAGEALFARTPHYQGDIGSRALESGAYGFGGGILGSGIASAAESRVRALRESDVGPALARAEKGGVTTSFFGGVKRPQEMLDLERRAFAAQRQPIDVMTDDLADPIKAAALRDQGRVVSGVEAEKALIGPKTKLGRQRKPLSPLARQVDDELSRLFDDSGRQLPVTDGDRKAIAKLAAETLEVRVVPASEAANAVRRFGGGGRVYGNKRVPLERLSTLLDRAPELADQVRSAQRAAKDPALAAKRGRGKVPDTERTPPPESEPSTYREQADTEPDLGDTILPPAPDRGTMPSPPFKAVRDRASDVRVEEKPFEYDGVSVTDDGAHAVEEIPGHVYVIGPRKLTPQQLQDTIGRLSDKIKDDRSTDLWKRLRDAGLRSRDPFGGPPGTQPLMKGATKLENLSAKNAEWETRLADMRRRNEAAGLPGELSPRAEPLGGPGVPALDANQEKAFRGTLARSGSGAGRELSDDALLYFAELAEKEPEFRRLQAYLAAGELKGSADLRAAVGSRLVPSLYTGNPRAAMGLRTDPAMRSMSKQVPRAVPISQEIRGLLQRILRGESAPSAKPRAKGTTRITPLDDLRTGATGPLSARQLGPAAGAGHHRREQMTLDKLPPAERELLLRLVELSQRMPKKKASGE